ncbi:MAG: hypothetical protein KH353_01385 [Clostridium sp.]|nr:hypothetical protein [Clostridium sp.]
MRFYQHLYMGEQAAGKRFQILQSLRKRKIQSDLYVITPASGGNNLLDIYSCREIRKPWHEAEDPLIVGIAAGYEEACCLAGQIVSQVYRETGGFKVRQYLEKNTQ